MNRVFLGAALVLCASLASGGEMDRKQTRKLESASKKLEKTASKLAEYEGEERNYSDRAGDSLERTVSRVQEDLAELPEDGDGVQAVREQATELEARIRRLVEAKGSLGAKAFLGSKAAKSLNVIESQLDNLDAGLEKYGPDGRAEFNDRAKESLRRDLGRANDALKEFPQDNPVVKILADRLAACRKQFESMSQDLGAALAAKAKADEAKANLIASPAFKGDVERVLALTDTFKEASLLALDAYHLRNPLPTSEMEKALALAEQWSALDAEFQALDAKYGALVQGRSNPMMVPLHQARDWHPRCAKVVADFKAQAKTKLAAAAQQVRTLASEAVAAKRHRAFSDPIGELKGRANYVRRVAELSAKLGGPDLAAEAKALEDFLVDQQEKLAADIIASNRAPTNRYAGGDAASLEAFVRKQWGEHFPQEKVLAVRFPNENFSRTVAWRWDSGRKQAYKVDQSDLWICVVVERGEEAILYSAFLRKLHLEQDRMIIRWRRPERVPPSIRMQKGNLD